MKRKKHQFDKQCKGNIGYYIFYYRNMDKTKCQATVLKYLQVIYIHTQNMKITKLTLPINVLCLHYTPNPT